MPKSRRRRRRPACIRGACSPQDTDPAGQRPSAADALYNTTRSPSFAVGAMPARTENGPTALLSSDSGAARPPVPGEQPPLTAGRSTSSPRSPHPFSSLAIALSTARYSLQSPSRELRSQRVKRGEFIWDSTTSHSYCNASKTHLSISVDRIGP
jgi:hypothetical protein